MVNWKVDSFNVSTSAAGEKSDTLYANGRMQVLVNVQIKASIPGDDDKDPTPYTLSDKELASIHLIDYFTHTELDWYGNGWVAGSTKTQFAGTLYSAGTAEFQAEADSQLVQFWVSSTVSEKKTIGASITQPDNTVVRTSDYSYNHYITLNAQPAITYTYPENVGFQHEKSGSGHYIFSAQWHKDVQCGWDQFNYYLTTKEYPLLFAESDNYGHWHNPGTVDSYTHEQLNYCYAGQVRRDGSLSLFSLWPTETSASQRTIGMSATTKRTPDFGPWTADAFADITVNNKRNSVCLSCVNFHDVPPVIFECVWPDTWSTVVHLTVYDIHGNSGNFKVTYSDDKDAVAICNDN